MSRKETWLYRSLESSSDFKKENQHHRFSPPPNGFCYKYILLDMKGSLTISASDLKCRKIFLERKSEVKQKCVFLGFLLLLLLLVANICEP